MTKRAKNEGAIFQRKSDGRQSVAGFLFGPPVQTGIDVNESESTIRRPNTVFQYQPAMDDRFDNLKSHCIYFGSPLSFNDAYDFAIRPRFSPPTPADVHRLMKHYKNDSNVTQAQINKLESLPVADLRKHLLYLAAGTTEHVLRNRLQKLGVACFSECNDSLLMWGHYGGKYAGLCTEFWADRN